MMRYAPALLSARRTMRIRCQVGLVVLLVVGTCLFGALKGHVTDEGLHRDGARRLEESDATLPSTPKALACACGLCFMFLALAIVCDQFFVPALEIISQKLSLSPDVAGATFMAAGGSAPEFFTSLIGALDRKPSDVGIATIVGSAVFNVLFVIGACGIASKDTLKLTWYPLARDSSFYIVQLLFLLYFFSDQKIEKWEAGVQFSWYICYIIYMAYSEQIEDWLKFSQIDKNHDGSVSREEWRAVTPCEGNAAEIDAAFNEIDANQNNSVSFKEFKAFWHKKRMSKKEPDAEDNPATPCPTGQQGAKDWIHDIFAFPIVLALMVTVPDVRRECCKPFYAVSFVMSILWIAVFSYIMVECANVIGAWTTIDYRIIFLTLIAAGTSVPDLLTSVIVTLQGYGDMAISSSIGSNIFDVTVGLPVPWLLFAWIHQGKSVEVKSKPLTMAIMIGALIAMVIFTIMSIMWCGWKLDKRLGSLMLVLYVLFMMGVIYQHLHE